MTVAYQKHGKNQYRHLPDKVVYAVRRGHRRQDQRGREYAEYMSSILNSEPVQSMRQYNHHSHTSCLQHSVHVSYYNYLLSRKLNLDTWAAAKAGLLHDFFLYDWHDHMLPSKGELPHGFTHPSEALKNAGKYFDLTEKEGDIILRHMFPLTVAPPKYKESYLIVLTDKFCTTCEVMDKFFKKRKRKINKKNHIQIK